MEKAVALTFDDGPDPIHTPRILDILEENNIKATFFLIGSNIETYPELVKRIYEEGHIIGTFLILHHILFGIVTKFMKIYGRQMISYIK